MLRSLLEQILSQVPVHLDLSGPQRLSFLYSGSLSLSSGIIDLSQVPHLPVLVPPSAGPSSSPMDRIAYMPGGSTSFPGRPYTPSSISPGTPPPADFLLSEMSCTEMLLLLFAFPPRSASSWVFTHKQDSKHISRTRKGERQRARTGPGERSRAGERERAGARTRPGERARARPGEGRCPG